MRIAYLSTFYPFRGGIAQFNHSLYRALQAQGHELRAYTFSRQYPQLLFPGKTQYAESANDGADLEALPVLDTINPLSWRTAAREIQRFEPDVLLMKYWMSFFAPSLGFCAGRLKPSCAVLSILDNVTPHERRPFDQALTRYFLKRNSGFVVMSESVERDLDRLLPGAARLFHRHPVYDHFGPALERSEARAQLHVQQGERLLLFYGFIRAYKGLDLLLAALDQLEGPYRLIIAGEAYEDMEPYQKSIQNSRHAAQIELRERFIGDEETRLLFSAADACVLPYHHATQSGIALIACHFNTPLIATPVGGLSEYIRDGHNGIMSQAPTPESFAAALDRYFQLGGHPHFSPAWSALSEELSWEHLGAALTDFVKRLQG